MKPAIGLTVLGLVAAILLGRGVAVAAAGGQLPAAGRASMAAGRTAPIDTSTEAKFTAITPCRIVDTRLAGGLVTPGAPRSFTAIGTTSLAGQGGNPAGCGIPAAAVAIQASVVTVGAAGSGYLKVYPAGAAAPNASFLNFRDGLAVANGEAITIDTSQPQDFTVAASRATQVVIDVSGYFIRPLWLSLFAPNEVNGASRIASTVALAVGDYEVFFDRDVSHCGYSVSVEGSFVSPLVEALAGQPNGVHVQTFTAGNVLTNNGFYLTVTC